VGWNGLCLEWGGCLFVCLLIFRRTFFDGPIAFIN